MRWMRQRVPTFRGQRFLDGLHFLSALNCRRSAGVHRQLVSQLIRTLPKKCNSL